jgi:hypothetical protein
MAALADLELASPMSPGIQSDEQKKEFGRLRSE